MKINVAHIAKLANLSVTSDEEKKFETQLSSVLDYIKRLEEVDVSGVEPTSQITGLENVFREDETAESLSQNEAISQTKVKHNGFIKVKGILDNE
ncbi:MAG TPA: Asp-tRNA(Asn)/Glu-tRNA(Gln) amidotransferase subunit GatC [Patescibacteria group bacterium]|nr:Asp-tRNA(Asn)/Glu-tRNA(Gln) amidotransferase subunit GatC [Patescibacteria group bacterium]